MSPDQGEGSGSGEDYEIGYCRPPVSTRFPNQRNHNSRGRRKGVLNRATIVRRVANRRVRVTVAGKKRSCTQLELVLLAVRNAASKGNIKASRLSHSLQGLTSLDEQPVAKGVLIVGERLTLEEWEERYGHSAENDRRE
jgi:hypothetical protein